MEARKVHRWQQIKQHPFISTGIIVACVLIIGLIVAIIEGYQPNNWEWTGFGKVEGKTTTTWITPGATTATPEITVATETQPEKTGWDWLGLLGVLAIPVVVGLGAAWYTAQQEKARDRENTDNQRETALQEYIKEMSGLLLHEKLRESAKGDEARTIARVRTLTILPRLDAKRKYQVLQFLYESGLIGKDKCIVDLRGADLTKADLTKSNFWNADLSGVDLSHAKLTYVRLNHANLDSADLNSADLSGARLNHANLSEASLIFAHLSEADLSFANLSDASLVGADLIYANLKGVIGISVEKLEKQGKSLKGATMPDLWV